VAAGPCVYHRVPKPMVGQQLYPLNDLRTLHPDIYARQVQKYDGRTELLTTTVPPLECLWNDVIHLSPIGPWLIRQALVEAGFSVPGDEAYFEIPIGMLASLPVAWYHHQPGSQHRSGFEPFDASRYRELDEVPAATKAYYGTCRAEGRRPLLFVHVPHVLVKGVLDVGGLDVVP